MIRLSTGNLKCHFVIFDTENLTNLQRILNVFHFFRLLMRASLLSKIRCQGLGILLEL